MLFTASATVLRRGLTKKGPKSMLSAMRGKSTIRHDDAPVTLQELTQALNTMENKMENKMMQALNTMENKMENKMMQALNTMENKNMKNIMTMGFGLGGLMVSLFAASVILVQQTVSGVAMHLDGQNSKIEAQNSKIEAQNSKIKAQDKLLSSQGKGWF